MAEVAPIALAAARWWADRVRTGGDYLSLADDWSVGRVPVPAPPPYRTNEFERQLGRRINLAMDTALRTQRWPRAPSEVAPLAELRTDYQPEGLLEDAAVTAGIPTGFNFPWKTSMAIWCSAVGEPAAITLRSGDGPAIVMYAERMPQQPTTTLVYWSTDPDKWNDRLAGELPPRMRETERLVHDAIINGADEAEAHERVEAALTERFESRAFARRVAGESLDTLDEHVLLQCDLRAAVAEQRGVAAFRQRGGRELS